MARFDKTNQSFNVNTIIINYYYINNKLCTCDSLNVT